MILLVFGFLLLDQRLLADDFESLRIGVIFDGDNRFPTNIWRDFERAIDKLEEVISVRVEAEAFEEADLAECAKSHSSLFHSHRRGNFFLIIQRSTSECSDDRELLAAAAPCFINPQNGLRPIFGRLIICSESSAWRHFHSGVDLFRHEILHSLGFGLLNPDSTDKQSPKPFNIQWGSQKMDIHFLDFTKRALQFGRKHFGCERLKGLEADNEDRIHLSEYIFGNELMTPILTNGPNYFTYFSALILEDTFLGQKRWYKTNKTEIDAETENFWYGKKFGCEFLEMDCFQYIQEKWKEKEPTAPFCHSDDISATLENRPTEVCFSNGNQIARRQSKCVILPQRIIESQIQQKLKPISLNFQMPSVFADWKRKVYGSNNGYRYCPLMKEMTNIIEFAKIPPNSSIVKCPLMDNSSKNFMYKTAKRDAHMKH